jgi:hypothetical protein
MRRLATSRSTYERPDQFLTPARLDARIAALHQAGGGRTTLEVIGNSRLGHPITMLSIGQGTRHAVVVGTPHPNEPTGGLATVALAEILLGEDTLLHELGLVWHLVPCADPDSMVLNQGWFAGPFTYAAYGASLYRPPFHEQFEWTFHRAELDHPGLPPLPETRAVMTVVDQVRPDLFMSLHNAEVGGMYCYVTRPEPSVSTSLGSLREITGVPLECGDPEVPAERLGAGVFHAPAAIDGRHHLCSTDYAAQYGAFGVTSEPPLWSDPRAEDESETGRTRGEVAATIRASRQLVREEHAAWVDALRAELDLATVRGRAVLEDLTNLGRPWPHDDLRHGGPATTAYATSLRHGLDLERVHAAGHVVALLAGQPGESLSRELHDLLATTTGRLRAWAEEATSGTTFVGLNGTVRCHIGVTLSSAAALALAETSQPRSVDVRALLD